MPSYRCLHISCGPCPDMSEPCSRSPFSSRLEHGWWTVPKHITLTWTFGSSTLSPAPGAPSVKMCLNTVLKMQYDWFKIFITVYWFCFLPSFFDNVASQTPEMRQNLFISSWLSIFWIWGIYLYLGAILWVYHCITWIKPLFLVLLMQTSRFVMVIHASYSMSSNKAEIFLIL